MDNMTHPTKQTVRKYIIERVTSHKPMPSQDEIRQMLGWGLLEAEKTKNIPGTH